MKTLIIIPSRLAATRLPGKPLLKIRGLSIISHVFKKAEDANIGEVIVAAEDQEIIDDVKMNGGQAILTSNKHKTGTDRIYEVIQNLERSDFDLVINLQGDQPLINIDDLRNLNNHMIETKSEIGTLGTVISDKNQYENFNLVKVLTKEKLSKLNFPVALSFMRKAKKDVINVYQHLGVYCYKLETLKKFVYLKQSSNEIKNKLEQLRALDNDIQINVAFAKSSPIGLDTEEDFVAIKKIMEYKSE